MDNPLIPELEIVKDSLKVTNSNRKDVTNLFENQTKRNRVKVFEKKILYLSQNFMARTTNLTSK